MNKVRLHFFVERPGQTETYSWPESNLRKEETRCPISRSQQQKHRAQHPAPPQVRHPLPAPRAPKVIPEADSAVKAAGQAEADSVARAVIPAVVVGSDDNSVYRIGGLGR